MVIYKAENYIDRHRKRSKLYREKSNLKSLNVSKNKWAISKNIADLVEVVGIGGAVYSAATDQELYYTAGALALTYIAKIAGNYFNNKNIARIIDRKMALEHEPQVYG